MVQVKVSDGLLEGEILEATLGGQYYGFKGIPYAQPPIGELRFKAPQPPKPWTGVRSAKHHGPSCYQYDIFSQSKLEGSEDCLYLNVYSPEIKPKKPIPVMVWIHGGGFMSGTGDSEFYGPDFLLQHEVILVTLNYRLEVIGFLSLGTEDVPGNAGMKDQVAALRWVKKNISHFGGDPNNITIFGESAGSCSVSYHLVSPMSKGLFKRAIMQSGVCLGHWAKTCEPRQTAITLARQLGCKSEDDKELYEFFKNAPIESLVRVHAPVTMFETMQANVQLQFSITDEKLFDNNERFFYGDICEHMKNGIHDGVEVLGGYVADEGYLSFAFNPLDVTLKNYNTYIESFCPLKLAYKLPIRDRLEIARKFKNFYYGKEWNVTKDNLRPLVNFFSFNVFTFDIIQFMKFCAKKGANDVYLYKFNFSSERNIMADMLGAKEAVTEAGEKQVVCHADDIMYLFDVKIAKLPVNKKSRSYEMIQKMTTLWTNFAKYGKPTPDNSLGVKWSPYTLGKQEYLDINDELKSATFPDNEELKFWESIYKQYYPQSVAQTQ